MKNDKFLICWWAGTATAKGNRWKNLLITLESCSNKNMFENSCSPNVGPGLFCRTQKGTFTLPQNKLLGFSSFCVQRSNQNPAENCKRIGLAGSTSASAPNLGPFQPPSRAAELIPYTEALQRRIIHTHNWFGSLILKESERKLNIYWKKKIETKKSYTARKLPFA